LHVAAISDAQESQSSDSLGAWNRISIRPCRAPSKCCSLLYYQLKTGAKESKIIAEMADPEHARHRRASTVEEQDEEVLAEFGYKQELRRDWGLMHNFGISFSIIVRPQIFLASMLRLLMCIAVSHHGYHNTLRIWLGHRWSRRYIHPNAYTRVRSNAMKLCPWAGLWSHSSLCS
jgi:hypothetical protein